MNLRLDRFRLRFAGCGPRRRRLAVLDPGDIYEQNLRNVASWYILPSVRFPEEQLYERRRD